MTAERPTNWSPPKKEIGGENCLELFAIYLYDQIIAMMLAETRNLELPIFFDALKFIEEKERITKSIKQKNLYFYEENRSIFADYKIMREMASVN